MSAITHQSGTARPTVYVTAGGIMPGHYIGIFEYHLGSKPRLAYKGSDKSSLNMGQCHQIEKIPAGETGVFVRSW
jgi:hypothetical protein